jgi:hypothetical protein
MKKLLLLGFAILLFTACESRYTQTSPEIDVIKAAIKDYEAGNWEGFRSVYADTAKSFHNSKDVSTAPDKTVELMKTNLASLSSYKLSADDGDLEMVVDDKGRTWVNFWGTWEGTLSDNKTKIITPVHVTFQMVNKKVVREYGYWDNSPRMIAEEKMAAAREVKSAVMTKDGTTTDAIMKKEEPKKKVAKNKDATMKKN